jgi:hypothetical protein
MTPESDTACVALGLTKTVEIYLAIQWDLGVSHREMGEFTHVVAWGFSWEERTERLYEYVLEQIKGGMLTIGDDWEADQAKVLAMPQETSEEKDAFIEAYYDRLKDHMGYTLDWPRKLEIPVSRLV